MKILQGKYLKRIESAKGTLKGIQLKTDKGKQDVKLPKALRAIAQTEIAPGDEVRVWAIAPETIKPKKTSSKKASKKQDRKTSAEASKPSNLSALQIIPLSPKKKVIVPESDQRRSKEVEAAKAAGAKTTAKKRAAKNAKKTLTVQLCQKKNCCRKGGDKLWLAFEEAAQLAKTDVNRQAFKLEAVGCLGGCKNGPNIRLLPKNVKHRNVKPADIEGLVGNRA